MISIVFGAAAAVLFWPTPRRQAVARVRELNGTFTDGSGGDDPVVVAFVNQPVTDADLPMLQNIRPLHRLLLDGSKVTDAGMIHLAGIEGLEGLSLGGTAVTDEGMAHLARIRTLRQVHVHKTRVSDAGLVYLHGLPHLDFVNVVYSRVTAAGVDELRRTTPSLRTVHDSDLKD